MSPGDGIADSTTAPPQGSLPGLVLVTGASGFIGKHLCKRLAHTGTPIDVLVRSRAANCGVTPRRTIVHDLGSGPIIDSFKGVDTVFHTAGYAHALDDPGLDVTPYKRANEDGTAEVVQAAVAGGVRRIVMLSSIKAMGEGGHQCIDETFECKPTTVYGQSKFMAEQRLVSGCAGTSTHFVILRLSLVHGPQQPGNLARMFEAVQAGRFPPIGARHNRRSMVHVADVVEAAIAVVLAPNCEDGTYIVAGPVAYSTAQLHDAMRAALGMAPVPWRIPGAALVPLALVGDVLGRIARRRMPFDSSVLERLTGSAWYSAQRLSDDCGWFPRRDVTDTLAALATQAR
ncbi:MAG: NAD-dependent epimerase/dehydratase family protein [Chromatiales bacterium]|nr:NAD-dependent epimerase/dehydratase family protein [Chromatiales bacterium]